MKLSRSTPRHFWKTISSLARRPRLILVAWTLFATTLLASAYRPFGALFTLGPEAWIRDNYSLKAVVQTLWGILSSSTPLFPPVWKEALVRSSAALMVAGIVLLAAFGCGSLTLKLARVRLDTSIEIFLFRFAIGFGTLANLSIGLALLGQYRAAVLAPLVVVFAAGTLAGLLIFTWRVLSTRLIQLRHESLAPALKSNAFWILPLAGAGLVSFVSALAPEIEYDSLWNHLWLPKKWLENGYPVDIVNEFISLYPLNWELVYGLALAIDGPIAAKLLHFACLPLTGLIVFRFAERFLPQAPAGLAVALFVTIPTILWEATTAYTDLALTFFVTLSLYAYFCYLETRRRTWLILCSVVLGLALATKHLTFFVLILFSVGLFTLLWQQDRNLRKALGPVVLLVGISLLFPLPWYLRNWFASGNPFFPDFYHLFGAYPPERWSDLSEQGLAGFKNNFGDPRTPFNLFFLPWNLTIHAARYGGSLGPILLLLLPGLLLPRLDSSGRVRSPVRWLLLFVTGYLALWAAPIGSFQLRFILPVTPALAILGAEAFGRLRKVLAGWSLKIWPANIFLAGLLLLNLPPFMSLHEVDRQGDRGWLSNIVYTVPFGVVLGYETENSYLSRHVPSYRAWQYINTYLPSNARILTFSGGDHLYSERERLWSDATAAWEAVWGAPRGAEAQALDALRRLGITHLLIDRRQAARLEPGTIALLEPELLADYFRLEYEDERFVLYQVLLYRYE